METPEKATNVTWHTHHVSRAERARIKGHGAAVLWFTGLSGAGKSTIANAVEALLNARGVHTYLLDGDNVRHGLNGNLGFSAEDRVENIRRLGEVAKLMVDAGLITLTAFISPYRADRARVRDLLAPGEFIEIHCDTPLATCEARDPKGLYRKARAGEIRDFTGIDAPYETPEAPEIVLDSGSRDVEALAREVVRHLETHGIVDTPESAA
jgi:adenylylsulfate kinase